jgi:hypothetical protein
MRQQPGMIVEDGDEVGIALPAVICHQRPMHDIRLPDVVGVLGLEPPAVDRRRPPAQPLTPQNTVRRR